MPQAQNLKSKKIPPTSAKKCFVKENLIELEKENIRKDVCKNLSVSHEHGGKSFCVLHSPSVDKIDEFNKEIAKKLDAKDYNFESFYFPSDINFSSARFENPFSFMHATFTGKVRFMGVFEEELDFRGALFEEKSQLIFQFAQLKSGLDLRNVIIRGHMRFEGVLNEFTDVLHLVFEGDHAWLDLQNTIIEKPERVLFHTVRLQPNWFVNVDCKKFVFTDCRWITAEKKKVDFHSEIDGVSLKNGTSSPSNPNALLTQTCLQLAENYESNKDYDKSSLFWQLANESKRYEEYRGYKLWSLHWWYWLLSLYGESWKRAVTALLVLITLFSIGYASSFSQFANFNTKAIPVEENADSVEKEIAGLAKEANEYRLMGFIEAVSYSLRIGALQRPEPQPANNFAKVLIALETIFVPVQAALLALAIRRKFMR